MRTSSDDTAWILRHMADLYALMTCGLAFAAWVSAAQGNKFACGCLVVAMIGSVITWFSATRRARAYAATAPDRKRI